MVRQFYDGYGEHFKLSDGSEYKYPHICNTPKKEEAVLKKDTFLKRHSPLNDILGDLKADDLVLIGVLLFLLYDGIDDYILLIILGIIFLAGIGDKDC